MDLAGNWSPRVPAHPELPLQHPKRTIYECVAGDLMVLPSASVVRRAAFEQAGGFDETLSGYEDDDLFVRFFRLGWDHVFVARPSVRFRIHANGSSASPRFLESRVRYAAKLTAILPDDPRMFRYYVSKAIDRALPHLARRLRASLLGTRLEGARHALKAVNHFAALRQPSLRLHWKLFWIQRPRLFRRLLAFNDLLPPWAKLNRNPTIRLR